MSNTPPKGRRIQCKDMHFMDWHVVMCCILLPCVLYCIVLYCTVIRYCIVCLYFVALPSIVCVSHCALEHRDLEGSGNEGHGGTGADPSSRFVLRPGKPQPLQIANRNRRPACMLGWRIAFEPTLPSTEPELCTLARSLTTGREWSFKTGLTAFSSPWTAMARSVRAEIGPSNPLSSECFWFSPSCKYPLL